MIGRGGDETAQETVVNVVSRCPSQLAFPASAANRQYHWMRHRSIKVEKGQKPEQNFPRKDEMNMVKSRGLTVRHQNQSRKPKENSPSSPQQGLQAPADPAKSPARSLPRRGGRVVECGGLENRCRFAPTQGSNPCLSAMVRMKSFQIRNTLILLTYPVSDPKLGT